MSICLGKLLKRAIWGLSVFPLRGEAKPRPEGPRSPRRGGAFGSGNYAPRPALTVAVWPSAPDHVAARTVPLRNAFRLFGRKAVLGVAKRPLRLWAVRSRRAWPPVSPGGGSRDSGGGWFSLWLRLQPEGWSWRRSHAFACVLARVLRLSLCF